MKSKILRWYKRHNNAVDAVIDIACDAIPGAGVVKGALKMGKGLADDTNKSKIPEIETLLSAIKPILADLVEDIEDLKAFKEAASIEQARSAIENSDLREELDEVMPQLSESITLSVKNLSTGQPPKRIINGHYQLEELIGKGGQGEVHKALHLKAQNHVAIKLLPPELNNDEMAIEALRQEYQRLVNNLRHPNIVQYRDLGQDQESKQWFIAMDCIDGKNLRYHLLKRRRNPFSLEETLKILTPIADALSFSHGCDIIHCDLKPENILIKETGEVFLTDFGLAHEVQSSLSTKGVMSTDISGTLPYMAPEQYDGKRVRKTTDVWALGIILYEMVEGYHPFNGKSFEHFRMLVCEREPEQTENLSERQWEIVSRMFKKKHSERPKNIKATLKEIQSTNELPIKSEDAQKPVSAPINKPSVTKEEKPIEKFSKGITSKKEKVIGFKFLGQNNYNCGGVSNTVKEYCHKETEMEFVLVPGGSFMMGDDYKISLSPYFIGKYQCTQEQWEKVMGNNPSEFKGLKNPVENVSWDDCLGFCKKTGLLLPTEAQWEFSCKAGNKGTYCFGDDDSKLAEYARYKKNLDGKTYLVGQMKPNAYGLYDMHGNVWEWCQDWYGDNPDKNLQEGVLRGGSCYDSAADCKSSNRFKLKTDSRYPHIGVRFVSDLNKLSDS